MVIKRTSFDDRDTGGLGALVLEHSPGSFVPTPASRIALVAVGRHRRLLRGTGIDWGCGVGCLAIAAARVATVDRVVGLDINPVNIAQSQANAVANGVSERTEFYAADSLRALEPEGETRLAELRRRVAFVIANPPASAGDDGFGIRRAVLRDAAPFLETGAAVLLNVSAQYGMDRVTGLVAEGDGYRYGGLLESTEPVPFDMTRPDLLACVRDYAAEEERGGRRYEFIARDGGSMTASEALASFERTGDSPLSRWQVHLFRNLPG